MQILPDRSLAFDLVDDICIHAKEYEGDVKKNVVGIGMSNGSSKEEKLQLAAFSSLVCFLPPSLFPL